MHFKLACAIFLLKGALAIDSILPPQRLNTTLLNRTWALLAAKDPSVAAAYEAVVATANAALAQGPWSVTTKAVLPPSGNPHDYASVGVYWWPCNESAARCMFPSFRYFITSDFTKLSGPML